MFTDNNTFGQVDQSTFWIVPEIVLEIVLLFSNNEIWVQNDNPDFDVTMGSFDGAEVCELVVLYLLNILKSEFGENNTGLYRDKGQLSKIMV